MDRNRYVTRRGLFAGISVAAAGCTFGGSDDTPTATNDQTATPTDMETNSPTASPTPIDGMQGGEATKVISQDGEPPREIINSAEPGDIIEVEDGVYQFSTRLSTEVGGEEDAPIEIRPAEGASPVFEWTGEVPTSDDSGWQIRRPYWIVRGLEIRGSTWKSINVGGIGHDIVFENLDVHDGNVWGIMNNGGDNVVFRNCDSYNHYDPQNEGQNSDGINMTGPAENGLIEGCRVWNNGDDGYDMWVSENHTIRYCWAANNGQGETGNGNGFKLGSTPSGGGGHRVYRCVAFNNYGGGANPGSGFWWNGEEDNEIEIFHCTAWDNPINFAFKDIQHVVKNNLSYKGDVNITSVVEEENNSWNMGIEDTEFASMDSDSEEFLRLSESSPAVDAGTSVEGLSVPDGKPDLGAFEHGGEGWEPMSPTT